MKSRNELNPDLRAKAEARIRDFCAATDHPEVRELSMAEMEPAAGGGPLDMPDLNQEICGYTGIDLYNLLNWVYTSYHDPLDPADFAKDITVDVAESCIPSVLWKQYKGLDYPDFITIPIRIIWRGY